MCCCIGGVLELIGNGSTSRFAGCGYGDLLDEVGHGHFNIKFNEVGEWVELHVAVWH